MRTGEPRFVFVTGEAGIGKSRLAEEFLLWTSQQGVVTAKARSYAAEGQLSLAPVTEYGQRLRFFEALTRAVLATPQPLLLLLDDVQWCDQETLEWLHFLLRFDSTARLLVVGCARQEELPPHHPLRTFLLHLRNTMSLTEISLEPLDAAETAKLASQVAKRQLDLYEGLHLYHETGGFPLFVVETVRADLGKVSASPPEADRTYRQPPLDDARTLPPRVYAVLVGRLQQLSASAHEFVEMAATIGREFTPDLLITDRAKTTGGVAMDPFHGFVVPGSKEYGIIWPFSIHHAVGGYHDGPNPGDLLCAALASCLDSTIRIIANLLGVILTSLEVDVTADVDVRGTLTVDRTVPIGFQTMRCHVAIQAAEGTNPKLMEKLLTASEYSCVTLQTLRSGVSVETCFQGS